MLDLASFDVVTCLLAAAGFLALRLQPRHDVRGCPDALWESLAGDAAQGADAQRMSAARLQ